MLRLSYDVRYRWLLAAFTMVLTLTASAHAATLTAMTFNTKHGGEAPWNTQSQIAEIVAEHPDIVFLQEAGGSQLQDYIDGINRGLNRTDWHGELAHHCKAGTAPDCRSPTDEAVMILTWLPITDVEPRLIWTEDQYLAARGVLRVAVRLEDGTTAQLFACHLPASETARDARIDWVKDFLPWARGFGAPRLIGGDFNDDAASPPIAAMKHEFVDAFAAKGAGNGATHSKDDKHYTSRIDYLFSAGGLQPMSAFVPQVTLSDHRPVVATYSTSSSRTDPVAAPAPPAVAAPVPSAPGVATSTSPGVAIPTAPSAATPATANGETPVLEDTFDSAAIDPARWTSEVFSGYQDMRIPVTVADGTLAISPLADVDGISRYNGLSSSEYDLSQGGYAEAQLIQGPVGVAAYAMFTVGSDAMNFYRIYQGGAGGSRMVGVEKKLSGEKTALANVPYDVVNHQYFRVRHDCRPGSGVDDVVFEASPSLSVDGFVELYREPWNSLVASGVLRFELKAGTSAPEPQPGVVLWDNFRAVTVSGS